MELLKLFFLKTVANFTPINISKTPPKLFVLGQIIKYFLLNLFNTIVVLRAYLTQDNLFSI